ncbi:MAG: HD-GYP domain-containing protein [Chloroflexota bacterium]|nr:HD-GYP domain-containing protein [Chloroflexota bacterium]
MGVPSLAGIAVAGLVYNSLNNLLSALIVNARTGQSLSLIWSQDLRIIATNVVALVPLAWLMAEVFILPNGVGWLAASLFLVPLFTTKLAYSRYVETRELFEQTIGALANAVDARDRYTRGHSQRVSHISEAMCRVMRLSEPEIEKIKWAGLLHDIGKIGIRDNVLLKPGPLDREERILMNQHPTIGAEIVAPAHQLNAEAPLIRYHHEWFNGSGYPEGKEALGIPLGARILTIADAYEAMTSSRPYRLTPLTHEQAVGELEKFTGIQFDPEIVPVLVGLDRDILDRPPDRPDELPTMLHADDPRDRPETATRPEPGEKQDSDSGKAASVASRVSDASVASDSSAPSGGSRAEDVKSNAAPGTAITPMQRSSRVTKAPSGRKGSPPRQALASDDVP